MFARIQGGSLVNQESSQDTGLTQAEFCFQPRTSSFDWKNIGRIKVKEMISDNNPELLPILLPNIAMSQVITDEDFSHFDNNEYLVKFLKLLQLANEYQANQTKLIQAELKEAEQEYFNVYRDINLRVDKIKKKQTKIRKARSEAKRKQHKITQYQYLVRNVNGKDHGMYYK